MGRPRLIFKPVSTATRLLLMHDGQERLRAALPPPSLHPSHLLAAPRLCEALALWLDEPLSIVLCAEEPDGISGLGLCDDFGFGAKTLHYEVEVVNRRRSLGSFHDLRQLDLALRGDDK
jgi:hypothetical protein